MDAVPTLDPVMKDDDPKRVEALFQAAADLPPEDRTDFLERECGEETRLRVRVETLLSRFDDDASLASPVPPGGPFPLAGITEGPGSVIGRYKLLQVIGEGGFGIVYMAEQEKPVRRRVAPITRRSRPERWSTYQLDEALRGGAKAEDSAVAELDRALGLI